MTANSVYQLENNINPSTDVFVNVLGYYSPDDLGGGYFFWDSTANEDADGGTIIKSAFPGVTTGRWKRRHTAEINVKWFGAIGDGITDNSAFIENAASAAITLGVGIFIPKDTAHYNITKTVRVIMSPNSGCQFSITSNGATIKPNQILTQNKSIFNLTQNREWVFLSIGTDAIYPIPDGKLENAFENNYGNNVKITGSLVFDGSAFPLVEKPVNYNVDIAIPIQISAEVIEIENIEVRNVIGYGSRFLGPKALKLSNVFYNLVGYRDKYNTNPNDDTYSGNDSYGDGIHVMGTKENAHLSVEGVVFKGIRQTQRSRVGMTLEFCAHRESKSKIQIKDSSFQDFAKCIHVENAEDYMIEIDNCEFSDFNSLMANAVNSPKYLITNCKIHLTDLDGGERVGGIPSIDILYNSSPELQFRSCDFFFNCAFGGNMLLGNTTLFDSCNFYGNEKEAKFYGGGSTVNFVNCFFENVGTLSTSAPTFSGWVANGINFVLTNCKFTGNDNLCIQSNNQSLQAVNSDHYAKFQTILSNHVPLIGGLLPYDPLIMFRRLDFSGSQLVLDTVNMPSPLWQMQKFSFFVISGNHFSSLRTFNSTELLKAEGVYIGDAIMIPAGYHMFSNNKYGAEPQGYEIATTNGGVTWIKTPGANVIELFVVFFPTHYKSFLI